MAESLNEHYNLEFLFLAKVHKTFNLWLAVSFRRCNGLKVTLIWKHVFKFKYQTSHKVSEPITHKFYEPYEKLELWRSSFEINMHEYILKERTWWLTSLLELNIWVIGLSTCDCWLNEWVWITVGEFLVWIPHNFEYLNASCFECHL